jgi:NAD+ synthase (glutamine-hydrolysing)
LHKSCTYNCRVFIFNSKIIFIRPKQWLANDGLHRELRWFTPWSRQHFIEDFPLPPNIRKATGQSVVPFGDALIRTLDTCVAIETCEELFTPQSPHITMGLDGAEIFLNGSASHHELRKLHRRVELIKEATTKTGGIYLYGNQKGCDGDQVYYDGSSMICMNGQILSQGSQFSLSDVEMTIATVDLEDVRAYRAGIISRGLQGCQSPKYPLIHIDFELTHSEPYTGGVWPRPTVPRQPRFLSPEEEIARGPACWLWDYLRRSRTSGFFLPLSGGADSCATALVVHSMCRQVVQESRAGNATVIADARRIAGLPSEDSYVPEDPQEFCNRIFHTCYMGTSNSGSDTRNRAKALAQEIGSYHMDINIDTVVQAITALFTLVTGKTPQYKVHGGSDAENLALQNVQARLRMVTGYLLAQLLPWVRGRAGGLLVLGSSNVDEALRGYFTKYDCSAADLNPIGSIGKTNLKKFIQHYHRTYHIKCLEDFLSAVPSAELIPFAENTIQSDEVEMGMTYEELSVFARLRNISHLGPFGMYQKLLHEWGRPVLPLDEMDTTPANSPPQTPPELKLSGKEIADKVKRFFYYYGVNRHKMTTLTPAYHAEGYSPDDRRFDLRPMLYNGRWDSQFAKIDELAAHFDARHDLKL